MVTTNDIIELGFEHVATAMNGGSKLFRINNIYALETNYDNSLMNDDDRKEVVLKEVDINTLEWIIHYKGKPNLEELKQIIKEKIKT